MDGRLGHHGHITLQESNELQVRYSKEFLLLCCELDSAELKDLLGGFFGLNIFILFVNYFCLKNKLFILMAVVGRFCFFRSQQIFILSKFISGAYGDFFFLLNLIPSSSLC